MPVAPDFAALPGFQRIAAQGQRGVPVRLDQRMRWQLIEAQGIARALPAQVPVAIVETG